MKILGYDYTLTEDGDSNIIGAFGRHHAKIQVIQIAEGLHPQQRLATALHEILHALSSQLKLDLSEEQASGLESGLFQVFGANGVDLLPLLAELDNKDGQGAP